MTVEESFTQWKKGLQDPAAHEALKEKFTLASVMIRARGEADIKQEQIAEAILH